MAVISGFKNRDAVSNNHGLLYGGCTVLKNHDVAVDYRGFRCIDY